MPDFTYPQKEKLKHKKDISLLFEKGKWQTCGQLRIITLHAEEVSQHKLGVSVSKRHFKKAVDRNRLKRMLREAYRLHKTAFLQKFGPHSLNMLFFISPEKPKHFREVEKAFLDLLQS